MFRVSSRRRKQCRVNLIAAIARLDRHTAARTAAARTDTGTDGNGHSHSCTGFSYNGGSRK